MSLTVTHRFSSAKSDSADATLVQPSNWNATHIVTGALNNINLASDYNFTPTAPTPTQSLTAGITNTITLVPVPKGINGTNLKHWLWITGGSGTAEAVLITGGTAVSEAATGTLTFVPAHSHSGAWTIGSATAGGMEAQWALSSSGGIVEYSPGTNVFHAPFFARNIPIWVRGSGKDATVITVDSTTFDITNVNFLGVIVYSYSSGYVESGQITDMSITFTQADTTDPTTKIAYIPAIYYTNGSHLCVRRINIGCCYIGIKFFNVNGGMIDDVGISSFMGHCIDIDQSFDVTVMNNVIVWPFACTVNQATAFLATTNRVVVFYIGHVDAYKISGCVTNVQGGYTGDFHTGADGSGPTGVISDCWFDGVGNMLFASGSHLINNSYQLAYDAWNSIAAIHVNNADVRVNNLTQVIVVPSLSIPNKFVPTTDTILTSATGMPNLQYSNCKFVINNSYDIILLQCRSQVGTTKVVNASLSNCAIERAINGTYALPLFQHAATLGSGDIALTVNECTISPIGSGSGSFCSLATDINHNFQNNNGGGYSYTLPATQVNTVWRNNVNFLLNYHRFQEEIKLLNGTAAATGGAATLAKQAGIITSEALVTAIGAVYTLTLTNSKVAATSICFASVQLGTATTGTPQIVSTASSANTLIIKVKNIDAANAFNGTIKISFAVFNI